MLLILLTCIACSLVLVLAVVHYPREIDGPSDENSSLSNPDYRMFYEDSYAAKRVASSIDSSYEVREVIAASQRRSHPQTETIERFVRDYKLVNSRVLEVGAGRGLLQDVVDQYVGLDISSEAERFFHKPFFEASATDIPFRDNEFDAIWTIAVLEHVPRPEQALREMRRVLKDGGILYLAPAWQCRSWAADGYAVRPYGHFGLKGRLIKMSIPIRESIVYRSLYTFPIRLIRLATHLANKGPTRFRYSALTPNYKHFWASDSDAVNSMDPYEAILWFKSRGDEILNHDTWFSQFFVRSNEIVIQVHKPPIS